MMRLILLGFFALLVVIAALWAVHTGGSVSFQGQGWHLDISLWAFVTSLLSGAGLMWLAVAALIWIIKSPLKVFSWIKGRPAKDRTADFLLALEYLKKDMVSPVKKIMPFGHPLVQSYLQAYLYLRETHYIGFEDAIKPLEKEAPLIALTLRMNYEKNRGDLTVALRYGLEVYQNQGPITFFDILELAEKTSRLDLLHPYLEKAYEKDPVWEIFKVLMPVWQTQGKEGRCLSELKKLAKQEQELDIFKEIFKINKTEDPFDKITYVKKTISEDKLIPQGYAVLQNFYTEAGLWGEAQEMAKHTQLTHFS